MKKRLALLILALLALTFVLTSCTETATTPKEIRWKNGTTLQYKISLADFTSDEYAIDATYGTNDDPYGANSTRDELVPSELTGTYTVNISISPVGDINHCTVTTTQEIFATYRKTDIPDLSIFKEIVQESADDNYVVLKSTEKGSVTFENGTQVPVKSSLETVGFYVGRGNHQQLSKHTMETTYSTTKKHLVAKVTLDGKTTSHELAKGTIDNQQILLYTRMFEKGESSFADSATLAVNVFAPLTAQTFQTTFAYSNKVNCLVYDGTEYQPANKLSFLAVLMDGATYMTQFNLPNMSEINQDSVAAGSKPIPQYTTYRFRVGYLSYELQDYLNDKMLDFVNPAYEQE